MKIKAAVLREANKPYTIEELELDPPKEKEVLVRYVYTGYCHSDLSNLLGNVQMALPIVAGHEAAGVVETVGPGCTRVRVGDHVAATRIVTYGECLQFLRGVRHFCPGGHRR